MLRRTVPTRRYVLGIICRSGPGRRPKPSSVPFVRNRPTGITSRPLFAQNTPARFAGNAICGHACYLDIQAANGVIEIGYIRFGLSLQRTPAATEALFLMLRHAMDDLGYKRIGFVYNIAHN